MTALENWREVTRRRDILKAVLIAPAAMLTRWGDGVASAEEKENAKKPGTCVLCCKCGQIKGSALCCKPGADKCPKCGLHKGSPGCCRLAGAKKPVCLCTYCGQIKGSDKCCKPNTVKCTKCGLDKGSPGCCRIKREKRPV